MREKKQKIPFMHIGVWIMIYFLGVMLFFPQSFYATNSADDRQQNNQIQNINTQKVVKVGFYHMDGFHYYNESGELTGYCVEYLKLLATFTGWNYEWVNVNSFTEGCEMLEKKEIDLIAPVIITKDRKEKYAYGGINFGTEYCVLITQKDRTDLFYEDYESFQGIDIAVIEGYPLTKYFLEYMNCNGFSANLQYYKTIQEAKTALQQGIADAAVTSILDIEGDEKLLARFSPQPYYFMTWQGNDTFLHELDNGMSQMLHIYPTFLDELLKTYYPNYLYQYYSRQEIEYIKKSDIFRVAYIDDQRPLSFTNENGEFSGISRKIFDRISELSGLQFEYVKLPEGEIEYTYLLEHEIDLITGVEYNSTNINTEGILLSTPYISGKKVMVSKKNFQYNDEKHYKIAIVEGSKTLPKVLSQNYPNLEIIRYDSLEESFKALYKDEVHLVIQNQYVVDSILMKPIYNEFVMVSVDGLNDELCFSTITSRDGLKGMSETESIQLITIINKAISQIGEEEINNIMVSELLHNQYKLGFMDFMYQYRLSIVLIIFSGIIGSAFFIHAINNQRKIQKQKEEEKIRLLLQQKRYKAILDSSEDLIYEISLNGEIHIAFDKFKEKFGWELPNKIEPWEFSKLADIFHIHPEDTENFLNNILTKDIQKIDELNIRLGKSDGTYIWCRMTKSLLMDNKNVPVSILGKIKDIDDSVKEKELLELRSRTDLLTGLLNKTYFQKEVETYLNENSTIGAGFLFIDMDHFKDINDKLGHDTGDEVIKETAKKIQLLFKNFDLVSRFGGDEFCVFVKEIPQNTLVDKLGFSIKKLQKVYGEGEDTVRLSASIGVAYCRKEHVEYKELLEVADDALYMAKEKGRDCYVIQELI
ncbi:MAG: transporter substrate-binding domain-containing protein [Lachnospiraceae bacterium]|nr:transporter substrate-binding domain-containing protein [Lachnospiraceae bacterium]